LPADPACGDFDVPCLFGLILVAKRAQPRFEQTHELIFSAIDTLDVQAQLPRHVVGRSVQNDMLLEGAERPRVAGIPSDFLNGAAEQLRLPGIVPDLLDSNGVWIDLVKAPARQPGAAAEPLVQGAVGGRERSSNGEVIWTWHWEPHRAH
jgi:hypothetical protein